MTPTVNGAHSAPEESKFVSKDDQHVNDLNLSSVTFDAVQSNICSDIDVTETVRVMKGAMQSPLDTDKNAARESESMEDLNSSSSRYPSAENDHQSGRIAAVVGYSTFNFFNSAAFKGCACIVFTVVSGLMGSQSANE